MLNNCSCQKQSCWTKEMLILSLSNFLLYLSMYLLLPVLPVWISKTYSCSIVESAGIVSAFALAAFVSGPFNSYIIDTFRRRNVGIWGLIIIGAASLLYPYALFLIYVLWIRIIQGLLFNVVTMSTGSTLLIDITPSKCRTDANVWFTRIGRLGMGLGLFLGTYMSVGYDFNIVTYISAGASVLAGFIILFINVPFRAPLKPSLCSFDRFLLPRTFPVAFNLILLTSIFGMFITCVNSAMFYIYLIVGFAIALLLSRTILKKLSDRLHIELGTLSNLAALLLFSLNPHYYAHTIGAVLFGLGLALVSIRFYVMIINLPLHCERGSANNTYYLMWELGIFIGFMIGYMTYDKDIDTIYFLAFIFLIVYILLYELAVRKWYIRKIENHN